MTMSMYYYDPDRNQVELLDRQFPSPPRGAGLHAQLCSADPDKNPVGIDFDPDELVERIRNGKLNLDELSLINA